MPGWDDPYISLMLEEVYDDKQNGCFYSKTGDPVFAGTHHRFTAGYVERCDIRLAVG